MKNIDIMRPADLYSKIIEQRELDGNDFFKRFHSRFVSVKCPACQKTGEFVFEKYGFRHEACPKCKTLFVSPRPTEDLLAEYYNNFKAPQMWTELLVSSGAGRRKLQYGPRAEKIVSLIRQTGPKDGGAALDIGAGSGAFALCLKETGFFKKVLAVDLSKSCVKACAKEGLDSELATVAEMKTGSFDLITINDLIEHLFDPGVFLKECSRVLKKNGFISMATPNGEGFDFKIMKEHTVNITPPEHMNYFNTVSIGTILRKASFDAVSIETPGKLDVEIVLKARAAGFFVKKENEYLDHLLNQDEATLSNFQKFLSDNKLSSHMFVLARKKEVR